MSPRKASRKTELVRGEPVIEAVLSATIEELATRGFRALSIEQVALRAGVARTTVYRRWPTKADLVRAAIESMPGAEPSSPEGADLRSKLIVFCRRTARFLATPHGLAVMRLFTIDEGDAELRATMEGIRQPRDAVLREVIERAKMSGEISPDTDSEMLAELLPAALLTRAVVLLQPIDRAFIERLVDFLLASARIESSKSSQRSVPGSRPERTAQLPLVQRRTRSSRNAAQERK